MGIKVQSYTDAGMPQPFADDLGVYVLFQHEGRVGMPGVVQPDTGEPTPFC
jgi:hypothetical protein